MTSIYANIRAAMKDMENPKKSLMATIPTKGGSKYTYKYESLDAVDSIVSEALDKHGLSYHQSCRWNRDIGAYQLVLEIFSDEERILWDERPWKEMPTAQDDGSWQTYQRRYQLRMAFNLVGEDDDGASATRSQQKKPDHLECLRKLLAPYAKARGISMGDATREIMQWVGVSSMNDIAIDYIPDVEQMMQGVING